MNVLRNPKVQTVQLLTAGLLALIAAGYVPRQLWSSGSIVIALAGISVWFALLAFAATWHGASPLLRHLAVLGNVGIALLGMLCAAAMALGDGGNAQWSAAIIGVWVVPGLIGVACAWPSHRGHGMEQQAEAG
ncbi:MAG: hypothetical protein ABI411_10705 [Tahibacter sp.]